MPIINYNPTLCTNFSNFIESVSVYVHKHSNYQHPYSNIKIEMQICIRIDQRRKTLQCTNSSNRKPTKVGKCITLITHQQCFGCVFLTFVYRRSANKNKNNNNKTYTDIFTKHLNYWKVVYI